MTVEPDGWRELVELERPAALDPDTGRLLAPIGPGWWHIVGDDEDRLFDEDAVRKLLEPGGWTLTGSLGVLLYGRDEDDDVVPLLDCTDEQLERTRLHLAAFERRYWPILAAMGNELGPDDRPSVKRRGWLWVQAGGDLPEPADPGKWCIYRNRTSIDEAWELVRAAVLIGRLYAAKCSTVDRANDFGGVHVICVYCPDSGDLAAVRESRAVLRAMGFVETLGYKTDRATAARLVGDAEWMLRE